MVKLFWVAETRQAIHFEWISVKLSLDSVAGDHVCWWNWIILYKGNHQASIHGAQVMGPLTMMSTIQREP